jgi:hypothetical protein
LVRILLPRTIRCHLAGSFWHWNLTRAPRPPMPLELRKRLSDELSPQVKELSALVGRDLSCWSKCRSSAGQPSTAA